MEPVTRDQIGRLVVRWRGPAAEARTPATRLRAERHLAAVDWQPPGLPLAAVLVLRRITGPALQTDRPLPSPDWQAQLQRQTADLYRRAARPALSPAPAGAPAVLFGDEGELLACLTADVLAGRAMEQWYWRAVWPTLPARPAEALAHAWSSRPAALPAGLGLLSLADATAAVALLDRRQVSQVVRALHGCFALPDAVLQVEVEDSPAEERQLSGRAAPWQRWLPEGVVAGLSPQAHYLLGLAAALRHAPTYARSQLFAVSAAGWLRAALAADRSWTGPPSALAATVSSGVSPARTASQSEGARRAAADAASDVQARAPVDSDVLPDAAGPTPMPSADAVAEPTAAADAPPGRQASVAERPGQVSSAAALEPARGERATPDGSPAVDGADPVEAVRETPVLAPADRLALPDWPGRWTSTGLGGVLYLINLLLRLDLPHGWTDPALAEHVSGWALLEALARALLATPPGCQLSKSWQSVLNADPLWAVLAALDGRPEGQAIGADLPPPAAFRLPATWLRRDEPAEPRWLAAAVAERLILWDAEHGYVVVDALLGDQGLAGAAAAELAHYTAAGVAAQWQVTAAPPPEQPLDGGAALLGPGLAWLVQRLLGFLRRWLVRALACRPAELDARLAELLAVEGRLLVSRTHVDLFLPMDRIDLAARRAGLDRDPGWVPDLGRIVSFHFV